MIFVFLISITGAAVVGFAKQQAASVSRVRDFLIAQAYAEAGVNEAYSILHTNFAARSDPQKFPLRQYGGGTYDASVASVGTDMATITCIATHQGAISTVKVDVRNNQTGTGGSVPPPRTSPWAYTVLCNGYITHNGSGNCYGNVHANNYITCNGSISWGLPASNIYVSAHSSSKGFKANGSAVMYGTVHAPVITVNGSEQITTKIYADPGVVTFPTLDLTPYYNIALANGQVTGSQNLNGTHNWGTIPGGVKWVNGTFTQNGSLTWAGCIIATGKITFNGSITQTRVANLPAIISRDSEVKVNGAHTVRGLVFANGNLTWNGAGTIAGSILVGGNLTFNGSYGILDYAYCEPSPDGGGGGSTADDVNITAWQR
jgi:hypothetical protein